MKPARKNKSKKRRKPGGSDRSTDVTQSSDSESEPVSEDLTSPHPPWYSLRSVFGIAMIWAVLCWCSFPPLGLWLLGWVATAPLIWLIAKKELPAKRPYRQLLMAGFAYWLATFYFIPIPHWLLWFGWLTVSIYLAVYTPLFVASARVMVHQWNFPVWVAAPVAFVGLEWIRCIAFSGQGMVCLSHSQYGQPGLIQIADLSGAYTVSFALVLFASFYTRFFLFQSLGDAKPNWSMAIGGFAVLATVFLYGMYRLQEETTVEGEGKLVVGIIQCSVDTNVLDFKGDLEKKYTQSIQLTYDSRQKWQDLDLILWPEGNLPMLDWLPETDYSQLPPKLSDVTDALIRKNQKEMFQDITGTPRFFAKPVCLMGGTGSRDPSKDLSYNSALFFNEEGKVTARYFKNHLVMFGEWVPFKKWLPFLDSLPIGRDSFGEKGESISINDVRVSPTICFDVTVPHLIRRQIRELTAEGIEPHAMINLTNDGWFYGTSCLDFHLACNVFRAVEMRKPMLVCANTGLSAEIDECGRLIQETSRRETDAIRAVVTQKRRSSFYLTIGDWLPISFGVLSILTLFARFKRK